MPKDHERSFNTRNRNFRRHKKLRQEKIYLPGINKKGEQTEALTTF